MAKPIEFRPVFDQAKVPQGVLERTQRRLQDAPVEHADAMLAAYEVLQQLHESGTLDLLRGMISAGDKIVSEVSTALVQPETIRGIRNLIVVAKAASSISPEVLERMVKQLPQPDKLPQEDAKPPSMFSLIRRIFSGDARRGLAIAVAATETLGRSTQPQPK